MERILGLLAPHGVGQLLSHSKALGADVGGILLGIGGSSTNDMGIGALKWIGSRIIKQLNGKIFYFHLPNLVRYKKIFRLIIFLPLPSIRIACDVNNPLLGLNGATYQFGPQKGLISRLKERMEEATDINVRSLGCDFEKSLIKMGKFGGWSGRGNWIWIEPCL